MLRYFLYELYNKKSASFIKIVNMVFVRMYLQLVQGRYCTVY
ncbi:hypothetical protein GMJAKD_17195 [Candidatus Electrothrix aarhusensis]